MALAHRSVTAQRIDSQENLEVGLKRLLRKDRRLRAVATTAGSLSLRSRSAGYAGLARIIVGQQVSVAAANAIWAKFEVSVPGMSAAAILSAEDALLRAAGLSVQKVRTLRAIAEAHVGGLDLEGLATADDAHTQLTAIRGVGPWTADVYLMFCLGHPDVFPEGDLALRKAVAQAFALDEPDPGQAAIRDIAAAWSPHRTVAAYLFWAYYSAMKRREGLPT